MRNPRAMLTKTEAFSLIESALGKGKVVPSTNVQCALRFPGHDIKSFSNLRPHIDSFHPSKDGKPGTNKIGLPSDIVKLPYGFWQCCGSKGFDFH